jgi:hypothetical protein
MNQITNHAFIVYKIRWIWPQSLVGASWGLSFAASLPDRKAAEEWIMQDGKKKVNYTILEVFRNNKTIS